MPIPDVEEPTSSVAESDAPEQDLLALAKRDPEQAARQMRRDWERSSDEIRDYNEQWKINLWRSQGYLGAQFMKVQDRQEAILPPGSAPSVAGLNKAQRLRRRLRAQIFADRAIADVMPTTGDDTDADRAEFSTRVLRDQCSEGKLDINLLAGDAFDLGGDYGSGFLYFYVEPEAGGSQPVKIKAHPDAVLESNPLLEEEVNSRRVPRKEYVLRFVLEDGTLVDEKQPGLRRQWLPKLCADLLTGRHVRFLPGTARDIWDAEGVQIGSLVPIRLLKQSFPEYFAKYSDEELTSLAGQRPASAADLLPVEQRRYLTRAKGDDALVFVLSRYHVASRMYPKGAYLVACGDSAIAYAGEWWDEEHDEPMDIPLSQFKHFPRHGNPYGDGAMTLLGPGNEILGLLMAYFLEHMDRFSDRKTFVPMTSNVRAEQLEMETRSYIAVSPNGAPTYEQIPDFPKMATDLYAIHNRELDSESGLQEVGQALNSPAVTSGKQAQTILQQVSVNLSDLREQTERGLVRSWRVMLQLMRARYTIPQLARFKGDDGLRYGREWSGSDLLGTADVQIARGSFTGLSPIMKHAVARELYREDQALTPQEYRRIVQDALGARLALEDDPHRERVQRQIARWKEGPPEGWQPAVDPATGQPVPDPLFAPLPTDALPAIAAMRMEELGRVVASAAFERHPAEWQQGLVQAFEQARQAAGQATMAEQQQAQAQAQAPQQQADQIRAQVAAEKAGLDLETAKIRASADIRKAELQRESDVLDLQAAAASRGVPVGRP